MSEASIARLRREYPDIAVLARASGPARPRGGFRAWLHRTFPNWSARRTGGGPVLAVRVRVEGIRGMRSTARCRYDLIVDTTNLTALLPAVWIAAPPDHEIRHVNVWPARNSFCRWSGRKLPSLCWHTYARGWAEAPPHARTLGAALEYAKQLLNTENHDSPAR
ncbi:hypothetical protein [Phytohabitans rumicis]|uniref:hypothetical protein n=1 Tax=Phytohabitans rumicis TaxID=1076125 RepID=UPI0031E9EF61